MKAAVLVEPGTFRIEDRPVPTPKRSEVLIRVESVGVCGTDLHIFHGHYAADKLPLVPGHELSGTIAALGPEVDGIEIGSPAVVDMNFGCKSCYWCRRDQVLNCPQMQQLGITMDGAFAEYVAVPADKIISAPSHLSWDVLALTEPLACVVRAARKSCLTFGQSVVVLGAGPIGNLHVQLLRTIGAAPIIAFDQSPERIAKALEVGADFATTDPNNLRQLVAQATDSRGVDVAIESVGARPLYIMATELMRKGGHLAAFGLTGPEEALPIHILQTVLEENSMKGSVAAGLQDMHDALTLLTYNRIQTEPFTQACFPLSEIQHAFETVSKRPQHLKTHISLRA